MIRSRFAAAIPGVALAVAAIVAGVAAPARAARGPVDQDARPFSLGALHGSEVALFFGYTHCPDVCPTVLATLALVRRQLPAAARLRVVFVTVDPARDTPPRVKGFITAFDPRFTGVTGDASSLAPLYRSFHIWNAKVPNPDGPGYLLAHESSLILIDANGVPRKAVPWNASTAEVARDVRALLP